MTLKTIVPRGLLIVVPGMLAASLALFREATPPVTLRAVPAARGTLTSAVTATGSLQPKRTVDIKYDTQDFVERLFVTEGQRVTRGEMLARMNVTLLQHALAQSRQIAERDDATLIQAEANWHRQQTLWERQLIARADLGTAQATYEAALHQREADRQAELQAGAQLERATLRAPMDGIVTQLYVHDGEMLGSAAAVAALGASATVSKPTNVLMTLARDGALEVWADVNAADLGSVSRGESAEIAIDAFRPTRFDAHVEALAFQPTVLNNVTTYQVKLALQQRDPRLRIGMPVEVMLLRTLARDAVLVPLQAVSTRGTESVVRVVRLRQTVEPRIAVVPVHVVARNSQAAAVSGTIRAGDLVVLSSEATEFHARDQVQVLDFQPNPTFEDLEFSVARPAQTAAVLVPGPKPKSLLQRIFGT
jgi:HlyD family secretion protein